MPGTGWGLDLKSDAMRDVAMPCGARWPALGLGTWRFGQAAERHASEVTALRTALELGYRLINTAEMYGDGGAERVVGEALAGAMRDGLVRREEVYIVSKVYPHNASFDGVQRACARSLARLKLDHVDLYLLHWPGNHPLAETVRGFLQLKEGGKIRRWGVSNFDVHEMQQLLRVPGGKWRPCRQSGVLRRKLPGRGIRSAALDATALNAPDGLQSA